MMNAGRSWGDVKREDVRHEEGEEVGGSRSGVRQRKVIGESLLFMLYVLGCIVMIEVFFGGARFDSGRYWLETVSIAGAIAALRYVVAVRASVGPWGRPEARG